MKSKSRGSMTVEAAILLPIVIFAVLSFLYLFKVLSLQIGIQHGLSETASETSRYAYIYLNQSKLDQSDTGLKKEIREKFSGNLIVSTQMNHFFVEKGIYKTILNGSMSYNHSEILEDGETIDIVANYKINIPVPIFNITPFAAIQRVRTRAFVGTENFLEKESNENSEQLDEEYVYITDCGTVYHRNPECSHLFLSIHEVDFHDLSKERNNAGGKYYPCERCCRTRVAEGKVYITDDGSCYHVQKNCAGLKRTVKKVLLSSVKDMRPCTKCGILEE